MMLLFPLLLQADPTTASAAPRTECEQSVSKLIAAAAGPNTRVVITFTGTQRALLPLDEALDATSEPTLIPIGADSFVLTVQVRANRPGDAQARGFAKQVCFLGTSSGGRFNGVMSFTRDSASDGGSLVNERMTDALMAKLPSK